MNKIKEVFKNSFAKNVMMITGGTFFAQLLSFILSPIISRLYNPEDFGVLTVYTSILGIIQLSGALNYNSAIPIAEDDEKAINIVALCFFILIITTTGFAFFLFLFGDSFLTLIDAKKLIKYKYLLPFGFFFTTLYTMLMYWAFRKKAYKSITVTKLSQSITGNSVKIGFGFLDFGASGLLYGQILKQSAGITTLGRLIIKKKHLFKKISKKDMFWAFKRYKKFPLFSTPGLLILSLSSKLPAIIINGFYGTQIVGLFGFAFNIVFLPMSLIGKSVQDVFFGEAANIGKNNPEKVKVLSNKLLKKLILIGLIPLCILTIFGPQLFEFVFGSNWFQAGIYARILSLHSFSHFIFHPISVVFNIFEHQKTFLVLNIIRLIFVALVFLLMFLLSLNSYTTLLILAISMSTVELLKYILAQRVMNIEIKKQSIT